MHAPVRELNCFLAEAKPSATYKMIDRVAELRAIGKPIISLTAGEPDFDTPMHVRHAAIAATSCRAEIVSRWPPPRMQSRPAFACSCRGSASSWRISLLRHEARLLTARSASR